MAERPLIALPARFSTSASALRGAADVASRNLVEAVFAAGGDPLIVHPSAPGGQADDVEVAARVAWADGVLLPGGGDLAGRWSGQDEHPSLYDVDHEQDAFDLAVARHCLATGTPLLAVCRGTQVVNVARGGTLVPDMTERGGPIGHHRNHEHTVSVDPGTLAREVVGASVTVSCYHHQCIDRLGAGLVVSARSEEGVPEAVEMPAHPGFFLGVQWHPEDTWRTDSRQLGVLEALVTSALERRRQRS